MSPARSKIEQVREAVASLTPFDYADKVGLVAVYVDHRFDLPCHDSDPIRGESG